MSVQPKLNLGPAFQVGDKVSARGWNRYERPVNQMDDPCTVTKVTPTRNCESGFMVTILDQSERPLTVDQNWLQQL